MSEFQNILDRLIENENVRIRLEIKLEKLEEIKRLSAHKEEPQLWEESINKVAAMIVQTMATSDKTGDIKTITLTNKIELIKALRDCFRNKPVIQFQNELSSCYLGLFEAKAAIEKQWELQKQNFVW